MEHIMNRLSENVLDKFSMDFLRSQVLKNAYGNDDTVIAALDRLKSVYMVDVAEEEKRVLLKCSREINDNLVVQSVVMRHEKGDRK